MAEDSDDRAGRGNTSDTLSGVALAALGAASREKADAYLETQRVLSELQMEKVRLENENLRELDAFELSHLRWRRLNDQMNGALRVIFVALGVMLLAAIAFVLWNARQADGLVIDSFSAPADFTARGMGGDVIATDITTRIANIRGVAVGNSLSNSSSVSRNGADDVKVDIPNTGVSLGEAWRLLRRWLGSERHISGSLREQANGTIFLRGAFDDGTVFEVNGPAADLAALEQQLAEKVFATFDPANMTVYLWDTGRTKEAFAQAEEATRAASGRGRADIYSLLADATRDIAGDIPLALARARIALTLDPKLQAAHDERASGEHLLGHDEIALFEERQALAQSEADQPRNLQGYGYSRLKRRAGTSIGEWLGDFSGAERALCGDTCLPDNLDGAALYAARRHDGGGTRRLLDEARAAMGEKPAAANDASYYAAMDVGDWRAAIAAARQHTSMLAISYTSYGPPVLAIIDRTQAQPMLAVALAHAGAIAQARATIADTPRDCYACVRARGEIEALAKNWTGAEAWFAQAAAQAPSLPTAYVEWGAMLLKKGDFDSAIAKLMLAHQKGPHFADPLELWGEALMQKNRSDLALAKFEEANRYAPNWGRLHLRWGEALLYAGRRDEAWKQFQSADSLSLTAADRAEVAQYRKV